MTAAHGLNGFTVEEVCEAAGISRRTFFNYFHSKEDAVIGSFSDELPADALEEFNQNPSRTPDSISGSLLAALHVLTVTLMERSSISRTEVRQFIAAVTAEPQLLARLTLEGEARERQFAELVAAREGLQPDHPEVMTATVLFGAVSKKTAQQFFSEDNTRPYRGILEQNLSAARKLFAQPLATSHQLGPNPLETSKDPA